jgi:hypothetical protein
MTNKRQNYFMLSKNFNVHSITHKSICNVIPLHMGEFVAIWDACSFMCRVFDTSFCAIIILSNKSAIVLLFWGMPNVSKDSSPQKKKKKKTTLGTPPNYYIHG